MKYTHTFKKNPALAVGITLMWIGIMGNNVLELEGLLNDFSHLACGAGAGLSFVGLLYASPKTRPLFKHFHAFKQRMTGRNEDS